MMFPKYIFVTGGVVSGLGKGITSASIGLLLKSAGYSVDVIKLDPYLNVDPGTMSPFEHGEVYVLDDGSETDLDLGHYERFLDTNLTEISSVTAGKVYSTIIERERKGQFLGKNVQLIPNITDYIQEAVARKIPKGEHVRLIEIGGSTGDMEGEVFLESLRQFKQKMGKRLLHVHLGYIPFLKCSGEYKSKPFQTSLRELQHRGLQPDLLVARYSKEGNKKPGKDILEKLGLFGNVPKDNVVLVPDLNSIYSVPGYLNKTPIINVLGDFMDSQLDISLPDFYENVERYLNLTETIDIGIVAKYSRLSDAYLSLIESLKIAGAESGVKVDLKFIDSEKIEDGDADEIAKMKAQKGVVVAGGFGKRGLEGKIETVRIARENDIPFLGICLGLQMAVVEYARNVAGVKDAVSSEMYDDDQNQLKNKDVLIDFMKEQKNIHDKGGTMRLGGYDCTLEKGTLAYNLYSQKEIRERHRHRYEVQGKYVDQLEEKGLKVSGKHFYNDNEGNKQFLVELIELPKDKHKYFIATQSHPEFLSRPGKPHPLFKGLVDAALE